jgi:hypothetical protein
MLLNLVVQVVVVITLLLRLAVQELQAQYKEIMVVMV